MFFGFVVCAVRRRLQYCRIPSSRALAQAVLTVLLQTHTQKAERTLFEMYAPPAICIKNSCCGLYSTWIDRQNQFVSRAYCFTRAVYRLLHLVSFLGGASLLCAFLVIG